MTIVKGVEVVCKVLIIQKHLMPTASSLSVFMLCRTNNFFLTHKIEHYEIKLLSHDHGKHLKNKYRPFKHLKYLYYV